MLRIVAMASGALALGLAGLYGLHLAATSNRVLNQFESLAANHYIHVVAEPMLVRGGTDTRATDVAGRLARAGLRGVRRSPAAGEFRVADGVIEYRRADRDGQPVRLELTGDVVSGITVDGQYTDGVALPAEHLTSFRDDIHERRAPVEYADLPPQLVTAVLAAEDRRFFDHPGVDYRGILRAVARNVASRRVVEGGSTITQQTVKVILNRTRRELPAKIDEAFLALLVERRFEKQQILQVYLNNVYLGHEGPFDIHGVAEGARFFFGRSLVDLSEQECFELAAAIRAPNAASPRRHRERLSQYTKAIAERASGVKPPPPGTPATAVPADAASPVALETAAATGERIDFAAAQMAYFFDLLDEEWAVVRGRHRLDPPVTLVACVDPVLQLRAARALEQGVEHAARRLAKDAPALQGAVCALDPSDGALRAIVGGRDYVTAPFNRATQIARQVGSTFKPFVYLAAFADLDRPVPLTQSTQLPDTLRSYRVGDTDWAPANFDGEFRGWVTTRQALEHSVNTATVALGMDIGVERVSALAERLGVAASVPRNPSIFLGAVETSPMRLAGAYACFANGGFAVTPHALEEVWVGNKIVRGERPAPRRVASAIGTYLVTDMLVGALRYGTGSSASRLGFRHLAAGKTGTSDRARDTWFAGFTPELVTTVWVGHDEDKPTRLSGASGALPVWCTTMNTWLGQGWDVQFETPPGVIFRSVDPVTGQMANSTCPDVESAAYVEDTAPPEYCSLHSPSFSDRIGRIFGPEEPQPDNGWPPPRKRGFWERVLGR